MSDSDDIHVGDLVTVRAFFTDSTGLPSDPVTVTAKIKTPAGVITTLVYLTDLALVRDGVGQYHFQIDVTASGTWAYRVIGTGASQAANEGSFSVQRSLF